MSKIEGRVEELNISQIVPYWRNAKKGNNVELVKKSIQEFGYNNYIVVDKDNCIIAGHSRYKALVELGYTTVKVVKTDLTPNKAKKYRLLDNKIGEKNDRLMKELQIELRDLGEDIFIAETFDIRLDDIRMTNFGKKDINAVGIEENKVDLENRFTKSSEERNAQQQEGVNVTCPHCYGEFILQK